MLVEALYSCLKTQRKNVAVVCSSASAGNVYSDLLTSVFTVHSFYGLHTADLPSPAVVERAIANNLVVERLKAVDTIIWDEISMSSRRVFELANSVHLVLTHTCNSDKLHLFGGKQLLLVGDFLQLRPDSNFFDLGRYVFESPLFAKAIPHRFSLTTILRQSELQFISCIQEVRFGKCSEESHTYVKGLARNLSCELQEAAVHIYFKRLPAQIYNLNILFSLVGVLHKFEASDQADTLGIHCPAERVLLMKKGCKVMLLWNKSDKLRNGSGGIFVCASREEVVVEFDGIGCVLIKRETWYKTSQNGAAVGGRTQFPLSLMWAATCHKSQGLTPSAAVIHCTKEFD